MTTTHHVIYVAATPEQAHLLKNALHEQATPTQGKGSVTWEERDV